MDQVTMIAEMDRGSSLRSLLMGLNEVPIAGRSIEKFLEEMQQQGWNVISSRANPHPAGVTCQFEYERSSVAM